MGMGKIPEMTIITDTKGDVFCGKCRYYRFHHSQCISSRHTEPAWSECKNPTNRNLVKYKTPIGEGTIKERGKCPEELNIQNRCKNFEKKRKWYLLGMA